MDPIKEYLPGCELIPFDTGCAELNYSPAHIRRLVRQGLVEQPIRIHPKGRPYWTRRQLDEIKAGIRGGAR